MATGIQLAYAAAHLAARLRSRDRTLTPLPSRQLEPGISVVIPSRNGRDLLAAQLPAILGDLPPAAEVLVVDNGSDDGTASWLETAYPHVRIDVSREPLSFARAANRGLAAARYARICLLNNDMLIDPGFFFALDHAFDRVPELFCATAQIRFPPGVRREETGKAVMAQDQPDDFPLRCDEPLPGEDLTWVLYGSGGCSLYDASRLCALGGVDPVYEPAYVEDLDLGFRAWQRGWPSVYVAGARVEHRHRATTSRYYSAEQLDAILEINYLRFLARSVWSPVLFRRLWAQALTRLRLRAAHYSVARHALRSAAAIALEGGSAFPSLLPEESVLALTSGTVFVFPGRKRAGGPLVLRASTDPPAARPDARDHILVALTDSAETPADHVLTAYVEVVLVRRGPFSRLAFHAAVLQTLHKWQPEYLECQGEAAIYVGDLAPVRVAVV